eukprot:48673_1
MSPFFSVGLPIGSSISVIIIMYLWYSLMTSFKKEKKGSKKMRISASVIFIMYALLNLFYILKAIAIPRHSCAVILSSAGIIYHSTKATLYHFFITRMDLTFHGSAYSFSSRFIKTLQIFVIVWYALMILDNTIVAQTSQFHNEHHICLPADDLLHFQYGIAALQVFVELILSVICIGMYSYKLYKLYKMMKDSKALQHEKNSKNETLLLLVKKQCKLAFITFITTFIIYYAVIAPGMHVIAAFVYIDSAINVFCVYCTFQFAPNKRYYEYLCNCNGNKYALYTCCGCCFCCNITKQSDKYVNLAEPKDAQTETINPPTDSIEMNTNLKAHDVARQGKSEENDDVINHDETQGNIVQQAPMGHAVECDISDDVPLCVEEPN